VVEFVHQEVTLLSAVFSEGQGLLLGGAATWLSARALRGVFSARRLK